MLRTTVFQTLPRSHHSGIYSFLISAFVFVFRISFSSHFKLICLIQGNFIQSASSLRPLSFCRKLTTLNLESNPLFLETQKWKVRSILTAIRTYVPTIQLINGLFLSYAPELLFPFRTWSSRMALPLINIGRCKIVQIDFYGIIIILLLAVRFPIHTRPEKTLQ